MEDDFAPARILIVLHGSIGDVTRALPLAPAMRQKFPQAFLAWSVEPACFPLLQHNPAIDELIVFERGSGLKKAASFLAQVRGRRFDLVLDLQRILKSGFISRWSGARVRIGFHRGDAKEFNWVFNNHHIAAGGDALPKLDQYLRFAAYLGIERVPLAWNFHLTADEEASVDRLLGGLSGAYAVLFVGTRWESKRWFAEQIAQCAEWLQRRHGLEVILLGAGNDQPLAAEARSLTQADLIDLVGRTSLREAIGIIRRARLAVGPDTGLMHIAAAVKTPVISLWGATRPERTGPFGFGDLAIQGTAPCVPCERRSCDIGRVCMRSITIDQIDQRIRMALDSKDKEPIQHAGRA
jgi:lipopolysaccharide heptosyltransferase II